jgi:hypothetical protein
LPDWAVLARLPDTTGGAIFTNGSPPYYPQRFYRARLVE